MNAMLLLVAILSALIAVLGYNLVTINQAFNISATIQQNQSRVQVVTSSVRTALTVIDGKVAVPISAGLTTTVPDVAPFRTSANGTPYVYCPILPSATTGDISLQNASASESYAVETSERNGMTYAIAGRPGGTDDGKITDLGIVAYVLTSQPNNTSPLRCADVKVAGDGTTLLVQGGSVAAIYDNPVNADGASFVVAPDGSRPSSATTSDRVARGIADVVDYVNHYDINDVRIRVFGGETFSSAEMEQLFMAAHGRTIRFQGPAGVRAALTVTEETAVGNLQEFVTRGRSVFTNVTLHGSSGADVSLASSPGGVLMLDNAQVARVRSNGGEVVLTGASRVTPVASPVALAHPVVADGGKIVFDVVDASAAPSILSQSSASVFQAVGGDVVIKSSIHAVAGSAAELFSQSRGGDLKVTSDTAEMLIDRGNGFAAEEYSVLQRVSVSCADGDASCTASCPAAKRVAWGECGSSNQAALSGFSVDATGGEYTCEWAQMTLALAPKAAVVCQPR